jgi:hypothetical protein
MDTTTKTLAQLANEALEVQNACNLSGVAHSFSGVLRQLRVLMPDAGTAEINQHCITKMWVSKLHDLARMGLSDPDAFREAYNECRKMAGLD